MTAMEVIASMQHMQVAGLYSYKQTECSGIFTTAVSRRKNKTKC